MTRLFRSLFVLLLVLLLSGCGNDADDSPADEPTESSGSGQTVQDLQDRVNAAWSDVSSYRVTSTASVPTDQATAPEEYTVEEWQAPNTRRIQDFDASGRINDQMYVDGVIYMQGAFVAASVAPEVGAETWVTLNPDVIPPDSPVGYRVAYLTRDAGNPFGTLTPEILASPMEESGTVNVGGRSCTVYVFGDTTDSGEAIRYEVSLDANDLPCQIVQRAGGFQNSAVWEINPTDLEIIAPLDGTPVSGTPEG